MTDVNMGMFDCLLGTLLPNVLTQNLSGSREDNMGSRVMSLQKLSSLLIDVPKYLFAQEILGQVLVQEMQDAFSDLFYVNHFKLLTIDHHVAQVVLLTS
jgi:hypothetical protein